MSPSIESSIICILRQDGKLIGTGFLVAKGLAVTCAHVTASAGAVGGDTIQIQFYGHDEEIEALVEPEYWYETQKGDVAFLRLPLEQVPDGIVPMRLGFAEHSREGNIFRSFGYATAAGMQGIKANGTIDGYLRKHNLVQLQSPQANHGMSGAPVLDEKRDVVVGMITKGHVEQGRNEQTTFAIPCELLFEICPEIHPSEICPYRGLESFTDETAQFFFGREALTGKLFGVLRSGCRFLVVFGPSGSGKSSVVRAGLLPALKNDQFPGSQEWVQVTIRPTDDPFAQMKASGLDLADIDGCLGYLETHAGIKKHLVLFVDQFEELFTLCPNEMRERFVRELATALENSRLILIISMRDDFYSAFNAKAAPLAISPDKTVVNVPVTLEHVDLVAMIERPANAVGLALEKGLTDVIIKDATIDGAARSVMLPLLEFALTQLWEKRRDGLLTHAIYQAIGGVTGSLARWADDAYSALPKTDQPLAEKLLTELIHLGNETQGWPDTRRHRALAKFDEPTRRVIKHFADRRLLVTGGETVELVHDLLVREWGRLRGWIDNNRQFLAWRQKITERFLEWKAGKGELINGRELVQAQILWNERQNDLQELREYILSSIKKQQKQRNILIGAIITVLIIFAFLAFWGQSNAVFANNNAATADAAKATSVVEANIRATTQADAEAQKREAQKQSQIAQARADELKNLAIAEQANKSISDHNPDLALALGMHIIQGESPPEKAYASLLDAAYLAFSRNVFLVCNPDNGESGWITSVDISPDDKTVAIGCSSIDSSNKSNIYILDLQTGDKQTQWQYSARILDLTFSPDGQSILAGYSDDKAILWSRKGTQIRRLIGHKGAVSAVSFSPDGSMAVTGSHGKDIILWDMDTGTILQYIVGTKQADYFPGKFTSMNFSPDGREIVLGDDDGNVIVWDYQNSWFYYADQQKKHSSFVLHVEFSPDGSEIISGSADSTVAIWSFEKDLKREKVLNLSKYYPGVWVQSVKYSPDGSKIFSALSNGIILIWDARSFQVIQQLDGHLDNVESLSISSDGAFGISGARDGTVRLWDLQPFQSTYNIYNGSEINSIITTKGGSQLIGASAEGAIYIRDVESGKLVESWQAYSEEVPISEIALSAAEDSLLTLGSNGVAVLWDIKKHQSIWQFSSIGDNARSVDINPTGNRAILGYSSGEITIINLETGEAICAWKGHNNAVNSVRFSSDGKIAFSGSNDYTVVQWDILTCPKEKDGRVLFRHDSWVMALKTSPNGKLVASASADGTIILWDLDSQQQIYRLRFPEMGMNPGLDVFVLSLDFSKDGRLLSSGSANGSVAVWSVTNGVLLRKYIAFPVETCWYGEHCFWVLSTKFSPKGDVLWASSADGRICAWPLIQVLNPLELRRWLLENRHIRELSEQEKAVYEIGQ